MSRPIRVLHVIGGLNRGGIETWLLNVSRHIDRSRFAMDFLVHTNKPCPYDAEVLSAGSKILPCLHVSRPWEYARNFRRIVEENGPYDVLHSHVHHFNGYVLRLAQKAGIPKRIAHSHNDTSEVDNRTGYLRRRYLGLMKGWIQRHATRGLGCSRRAASCLFGKTWEQDSRWRTLPYSIDFKPFGLNADRNELRRELHIRPDDFVIGHVGRFVPQKNHPFILQIAKYAAERDPHSVFLLVGDGPLRPMVERQVNDMGLRGRVLLTGNRPDIPRLMTSAMDAMVLPSLHEGLGLVLVEAQAAGLPCVFSDSVPEEAVAVPPLMRAMSLAEAPEKWAAALLSLRSAPPAIDRPEALARMQASSFNIQVNIHELERVYLA